MKRWVLIICTLFSLTGWTDDLTITISPKNPQFKIQLDANPTTGYQWTLKKYDSKLLKLISSQYAPAKTQLMGAGGKMIFTFNLVNVKRLPQETLLEFEYARPWEKNNKNLKIIKVIFQSDPI